MRGSTCPSCGVDDVDLDGCAHCGFRPPPSVRPGTIIQSRYILETQLGRGGMGVVYKAHDKVLDEPVAIKLLRTDGEVGDLARRFRAEIKLARKVTHRNVCRIHEYGEDHGVRFISMEFTDGVTLRQLLATHKPTIAEGTDIAIQIANGLEAIHEVGIIHRDLKPANIMRDCRGVVKLMDFGIAKEHGLQTDGVKTATGLIVGTPEYMSPEQARGGALDFRSDIYAFGVVLFELFTGRVPFRGDSPLATIVKHLHEPPPLDGPGARNLPQGLVAILRRALAKEPGHRFPSAQAIAHALRSLNEEVPEETLPGTLASTNGVGTTGSVGATRAVPGTAVARPPHPRMLTAFRPAASAFRPGPSATQKPWAKHSRREAALLVSAGIVVALGAWMLGRLSREARPPIAPRAATTDPERAPESTVTTTVPPERVEATPSQAYVPSSLQAQPKVDDRTPPPQQEVAPSSTTPRPPKSQRAESRDSLPVAHGPESPKQLLPREAPTRAEPQQPPTSTLTANESPVPPAVTPPHQTDPAPPIGDVAVAGPDVEPPQIRRVAAAVYPPLAKRANRETTLLVRVLIDESGKVVKAEITLGDASGLGFNEAAVEAAYRTTFSPARRNGVPVKMWTHLPVLFSRR